MDSKLGVGRICLYNVLVAYFVFPLGSHDEAQWTHLELL